ncbi:15-hydroxyprostaglandin dehydrogenase [NAD(+)] [Plakobranchus ocellatus]|uniref:15-hydroxyprostaglandin dehydrogenase [NAD(+)] n=1 Tax=Plakobranchus ocellatus TaxID=259542 RepID=A0AAV4AFT9_9GAST|nr:15-hydroxyprostaglandin dehydrogenase [NAD(+)] [Plakobranchus ocellatus]
MSLAQSVAVITGAGQGLGRAFAEILLKNGAKVLLTDINETVGQKTLSELAASHGQDKVAFLKSDVTKETDFQSAFSTAKSKLGAVNIMVNNAGTGNEKDAWESTIDINVKGTIKGTKVALDHFRKDKGGNGGVIINVASIAGLNPNPCGPVYGASKAAIIMFSQCWGMNTDAVSNGVRINVLAPAFAETEMVKALRVGKEIHKPEIATQMLDQVGVLPVEKVAEAFLELVTDTSKNNAILKVSAHMGKGYHSLK